MQCPICHSGMKPKRTNKGVLFLVCSQWPHCRVSGTPELLKTLQRPRAPRDVTKLGDIASPLAHLRILQSQYKRASGKRRDEIREQARKVVQGESDARFVT